MTYSHTCGSLKQNPTPFPHTIRPPSLVSIPIAPPRPKYEITPVAHVVACLLKLALANDLSQDQAYMPMEGCTLPEAVLHLRRYRHLLIQGGCLYYGAGGVHAKMWGRREFPALTVQETLRLLKANYPLSKGATRRHPADLIHDRPTVYVPVVRVQPVPVAGVGFFCTMPYGTDIDLIPESAWQVIAFPQGLSHQLLFIGDISLDGLSHYVWWSVPVAAYICQEIPHPGDHHATE